MSAWVGVLIGVGGTLFGLFLRSALERGTELRTRQLEAADELLAAVIPVLDDLGRSGPEILGRLEPVSVKIVGAKPPDEALRDIDAAARALVLHQARIGLSSAKARRWDSPPAL